MSSFLCRLFGQDGLCASCEKRIRAFEMTMRVRDKVYHLECFKCAACQKHFCVGDRYLLINTDIVCEQDIFEWTKLNSSLRWIPVWLKSWCCQNLQLLLFIHTSFTYLLFLYFLFTSTLPRFYLLWENWRHFYKCMRAIIAVSWKHCWDVPNLVCYTVTFATLLHVYAFYAIVFFFIIIHVQYHIYL